MATPYRQIVRDGLWDNNGVLAQMLGMCPTMAMTTSATNGLGMGLATAFVMATSNLLIAALRGYTPGVVTSNDNYAARLKGKDYTFKGVTVKRGGRIGAQATILPGKVINEDGFAAAGSVVTKDIPAKNINCGNPAKYFRDVPEDQLIDNQ